jgi:hypothetical protein
MTVTAPDPGTLPTAYDLLVSGAHLPTMLAHGAAGTDPGERAAVQLLIRHGYWPADPCFQRLVLVDTARDAARIDWQALADDDLVHLPAPAAERQVLVVAVGLATGEAIDLRGALAGLPPAAAELVAAAVLRAAGLPA